MKLIKDLGQIPISDGSKYKARFGIYECSDCFKHFKANTSEVKSRDRELCKECSKDGRHKTTHGMTGSRLHTMWTNMMARCYKDYSTSYKHYGAIGISVCDEWHSFLGFQNWALSNGYSDLLEIERKESEKNYNPSNCIFADNFTQSANRKSLKHGIYKHGEKFKLMIGIKSKPTYLGLFDTEEDALVYRNKYIKDNNLPHKIY